jgi:ABC-type uncharacterized transport system permease subunit
LDLDLLLARLDLAFYLVGIALAFASVLGRRPEWMRWVPALALGGLLLHGASLLRLWYLSGSPPLGDAPARISVLAWAAVLVYLVAAWVFGLEILGVIILPLAAVLTLVSGFLPTAAVRVPEAITPGLFWFHIGVATLGVAALFLAFGASLAYLVQDRGLKAKRPSRVLRWLPSLERCDTAGHGALLWGFPLLTVAIVTGAIWSANIRSSYWGTLSRETLALVAWGILAIVLYARLVSGWRGRKAAYLTIVAFAAVLLRMLV